MIDARQIAAFVEFVVRPLSDDWRQILDRLKELNLPLSESLIERTAKALIAYRVFQEVLRAVVYLIIVGMVCITAHAVLAN